MKGRTECKESILLWTMILHSQKNEWLLLLPAALGNLEGKLRSGGGEESCTALLFCPFVETCWAKHKQNICNRSHMEAEDTEVVLRAGRNSPSLLV